MIYCQACGTNLSWPWNPNAPTKKAKCQVCKKEKLCFDSDPKKPEPQKPEPQKPEPQKPEPQKPEPQKATKQKYQRYQ
jgi:hypothetical protein